MNLILITYLIIITLSLTCNSSLLSSSSSSSASPGCSLLPAAGTESMDFAIVAGSTKNFTHELLKGNCRQHNVAMWFNLSVARQDTPMLIFIVPESVSQAVENLNQIGELLILDQNSISEVWDPIFFIVWPNHAENTVTSLSTANDLKVYLQSHLSTEIRLDSDVFIIFYPRHNATADVVSDWVYEIFTTVDKLLQIQPIPIQEQSTAMVTHAFETYLMKSVRRQNFNGAVLKVVGLMDPDFIDQCKYEVVNGVVIFINGMGVHLLFALQYALNFSYFGVAGEGWIELLENGSWTGMARQIRAGEADFSISLSSHLLYRFKGVGFLHPTTMARIRVFFRQPPVSSMRDIFLSPFNAQVWALLVLLWFLFTASMCVLYWVHVRYGGGSGRDGEGEGETGPSPYDNYCAVQERFFWCLRTFCQKSSHICPSTESLRIVFISSLFVGGIYYVAYCASLVSTLSIVPVPIKTIQELSSSELTILGDFWLPNNREIVQSIEGGRRRRPTAKLTDKERFIYIDHAIPQLLSTSTAFTTFADGFMTAFHRFNYNDRYFCDTFSSINPMRAPISSGMFVQRGSPLKELLNPKILMMSERGINTRLNQHYMLATSAQCTEKRTRLGQSLQVSDIFTAYFLIGGGLMFGFVLSVIEYFVHRASQPC